MKELKTGIKTTESRIGTTLQGKSIWLIDVIYENLSQTYLKPKL